jgi:hypothetical protein
MYAELIKTKFPSDENLGLFVAPSLPAVKLGKVLSSETRIKQPGDVLAFHLDAGFFSSSYIILTATECFYPGSGFALAEVRDARADGKFAIANVNLKGSFTEHKMGCGSEGAAKVVARILNDIGGEKEEIKLPEPTYEGFDKAQVDWLKLRDEVMKTIDLLYEKFNDGKLSLLEYEEKKSDLLMRL